MRFEWNLKSAATAVGALWSGAADIGITGRGVLWSERLAFQRQYNYDITEIVSTTSSYNVPLTAAVLREQRQKLQ